MLIRSATTRECERLFRREVERRGHRFDHYKKRWKPLRAAITHVANDVQGTAATSPLTLTVASTGAGHLLVCFVSWQPTTSTCTVSGNGSGAFTASSVGKISNGTSVSGELFYIQGCAGGDTTITITITGATEIDASFCEFAGAATSGGEDGNSSGTGTATSMATGTLTSVGTGDVVVGGAAVHTTTANTYTAGAGFTLSAGAAELAVGAEWQIFTAAVNQTVPMTRSASNKAWVMIASAFKAAAGGLLTNLDFTPGSGRGIDQSCAVSY